MGDPFVIDGPVSLVDQLLVRCPENTACPTLASIRAKLMHGEWAEALRVLTHGVGPCGFPLAACQESGARLLREMLVREEKERLRALWKDAFGDKPLEIDFICHNMAKMGALQEAMKVADVVPLSFSLRDHPSGAQSAVRVTVEV